MSKKKLYSFSLLMGFMIFNFKCYGANEAECAIWLCAPAGFPKYQACIAAHAAMIERIKEFKPIFPSLSSCEDKKNNTVEDVMGYTGKATLIKQHKVCVSWALFGDHGEQCKDFVSIPKHYVKDTLCNTTGCSKVVYYAEVQDNKTKERIGKTFYIGRKGEDAPYYPSTSSNDYNLLYKPQTKESLLKYVDIINENKQKDIDLDNEYDKYTNE